MEEKLLKTKKNGMAVLLLVIAAIVADFALVVLSCTIWGTAEHPFLPLFIPTLVLLCVIWILFLGFKVLKPQDPVRRVHRNHSRARLLFCQSVLRGGQSGSEDKTWTERRRRWGRRIETDSHRGRNCQSAE